VSRQPAKRFTAFFVIRPAAFSPGQNSRHVRVEHTFTRRGGRIRHFWTTELQLVREPKRNRGHLDTMWPLWNVLDMTPGGCGVSLCGELAY
jgi:predicted dithiol-disulfide oxidoreductase (DUF899 family)